jgi:hypothetical protein
LKQLAAKDPIVKQAEVLLGAKVERVDQLPRTPPPKDPDAEKTSA